MSTQQKCDATLAGTGWRCARATGHAGKHEPAAPHVWLKNHGGRFVDLTLLVEDVERATQQVRFALEVALSEGAVDTDVRFDALGESKGSAHELRHAAEQLADVLPLDRVVTFARVAR